MEIVDAVIVADRHAHDCRDNFRPPALVEARNDTESGQGSVVDVAELIAIPDPRLDEHRAGTRSFP
jgi:hypothetical protein